MEGCEPVSPTETFAIALPWLPAVTIGAVTGLYFHCYNSTKVLIKEEKATSLKVEKVSIGETMFYGVLAGSAGDYMPEYTCWIMWLICRMMACARSSSSIRVVSQRSATP